MTERKTRDPFAGLIVDYVARNPTAPLRPRRLARQMGIDELEYPRFREAFAELRRAGRLGKRATAARTLVGRFHGTQRGFGFVRPEGPEPGEDIYVPLGSTGGALTGDLVVVELERRGRRGGSGRAGRGGTGSGGVGPRLSGEVVEVLERALEQVVGVLELVDGTWFLQPEGGRLTVPVVIDDPTTGVAGGGPPLRLAPGTKALVEIVEYPRGPGMLPAGVVRELLGAPGELEVETRSIVLAHGLPHRFSEAALEQARRAAEAAPVAPGAEPGTVDLTGLLVVTIDPEDARDYDDAVSLERAPDGATCELGVHIADVSRFVEEGSALDLEARERGTSVYFPRQVVPMLPPALSQGACALAPGQHRHALSVLITYDAEAGEVLGRRVRRSVIASRRRLTYEEAQQICDGHDCGAPVDVVDLLRSLERLARAIRRRRLRGGMLSLDLPEVSLVLDEAGHVVDARPEPDLFSHTLIEMLMVEANEAVAELLAQRGVPVMRRVHPPPKDDDFELLRRFARAAGHEFPDGPPGRAGLQRLIEAAKGRPESHVINLALLRSMRQACYSFGDEGHFALASERYCHFTSPIRRYPDLLVHRAVSRSLLGGPGPGPGDDAGALEALARHCTETERRAEAAEQELRQVLVLQHVAGRVGTTFRGVVTGVTGFGLFVQSPRFLVEGLLPQGRPGSGRWDISPDQGVARDPSTGAIYRLGDVVDVAIARVDVAQRHLDLELVSSSAPGRGGSRASTSCRRGAGAGAAARRSSSSRSR
jgi:ribonuclease R